MISKTQKHLQTLFNLISQECKTHSEAFLIGHLTHRLKTHGLKRKTFLFKILAIKAQNLFRTLKIKEITKIFLETNFSDSNQTILPMKP